MNTNSFCNLTRIERICCQNLENPAHLFLGNSYDLSPRVFEWENDTRCTLHHTFIKHKNAQRTSMIIASFPEIHCQFPNQTEYKLCCAFQFDSLNHSIPKLPINSIACFATIPFVYEVFLIIDIYYKMPLEESNFCVFCRNIIYLKRLM